MQGYIKKIIIGFEGVSPDDPEVKELYDILAQNLIAGVILFRHNIVSFQQAKTLIQYLKSAKQDCIVSIDQEGGAVSRIDSENGADFDMPKAADYESANQVYDAFDKMGSVLAILGVNLNYAPVLDVNINPLCPIIGAKGRSFSDDPDIVAKYAREAMNALKKHGVKSCAKHFPGHGSASTDTHLEFADISHSWQQDIELQPFRELQNEVDYIMMGHLYNSNIDSINISSISKKTYELLSGFKGRFITDDYFMKAISDKLSPSQFLDQSIRAGAGLVIFGRHPICIKRLGLTYKSPKQFLSDLA